jgi:uncharacterized protein YllA (UPF0747 family)
MTQSVNKSTSLIKFAENLSQEHERSRYLKEHSTDKFNRKIDQLKERIGRSRDILKDINT